LVPLKTENFLPFRSATLFALESAGTTTYVGPKRPVENSTLFFKLVERPTKDGKSPCRAKSTLPFASASLVAGPAPGKNNQVTLMPSFLNSCSSTPRACAVATKLPPTRGLPPSPAPETEMRISLGLAACTCRLKPSAESAKNVAAIFLEKSFIKLFLNF